MGDFEDIAAFNSKTFKLGEEIIAAALLAVERETREADCAAVCLHCREGLYSVHSANCNAIRAAAEKEEP
jgi:hypothetical protein